MEGNSLVWFEARATAEKMRIPCAMKPRCGMTKI
jgi:hypothetical protein